MKRVDRRQELRAKRISSIMRLGFPICLVVSGLLISFGSGTGSSSLFAFGIAVLLSGILWIIFPDILIYRRWKNGRYANPWRARLRTLLGWGVFACALITAGLFFYGFAYEDLIVVRMGILIMLIAGALFVGFMLVPRSKTIGESYREAVHLSISKLSDARGLGLEWPDDKQGLWIGVKDLNIVDVLDAKFLLANTPHEYRIFMAVSAWTYAQEHEKLRKLLSEVEDHYEEQIERRRGDTWNTIFASTRDEAAVRHVFENYQFYYGTYSSYPFIVAKGELPLWIDSLRRLSKKGLKGLTQI